MVGEGSTNIPPPMT